MSKYVLTGLLLVTMQISGCASVGQVKYIDETYTLNRSDILKDEDGRYTIIVWGQERSGLIDLFGGYSPIGVQIKLPDNTKTGMACEIGKDCNLWVRGHDSEIIYLFLVPRASWFSADSGRIEISEWNLIDEIFAGTFDAETGEGHISGKFRVRPQARSE